MKIGIVLEGGAMRGMYTAGVLDILMDLNLKVTDMVGVSAGVLFGVNYPSRQKGRAIRYNKKYIKDRRYTSFHSLITTGNIINKDFAFYKVPLKLDVFDEKAYEQSGIRFYATVTNVKTGKAEYIKIKNVLKEMEVLRASSAMPYVSKMVEWSGNQYLDGGIADSIPVEACKKLGCDKIILILTRPITYRKAKTPRLAKRLNKMLYRNYPNLIKALNQRNQNYNCQVESVIEMEKREELFVIRPSKPIQIKRIEKDINKLQEVYDLGVRDAKHCITELQKYLAR